MEQWHVMLCPCCNGRRCPVGNEGDLAARCVACKGYGVVRVNVLDLVELATAEACEAAETAK